MRARAFPSLPSGSRASGLERSIRKVVSTRRNVPQRGQRASTSCTLARGRRQGSRRSPASGPRARRRRWLVLLLGVALLVAGGAIVAGVRGLRRASEAAAESERRQRALAIAEGTTWKEPRERIEIVRRALAVDPTWLEGYAELSAAYIKQALYLRGSNPEGCARCMEASRETLDRALAIDPNYVVALYYRGYSSHVLGERERALPDLRRAAEIGPDEHDGQTAATLVALAEGRFKDAERHATAAIQSPGDEDDHAWRAVARYVLGDLEGGIEDIASAEEILPGDEDYVAYGALFLLARGERYAAANRLLAGVRAQERTPHILPLLAYLAATRGDEEEARALEAKARAEFAAYARCFLDIAIVNRALLAAPPPRDVLARAFILEQDLAAVVPPEPADGVRLRARGEDLFARGEAEAALALAERAIAAEPVDGGARLLAARCLARLGHAKAARHEAAVVPPLAPSRAEEARALLRELDAASAAEEPGR